MPGHPTLGSDCEETEDLPWTSLDLDSSCSLSDNPNQCPLESEHTGSFACDHIPLEHLVLVELLLHMEC